jgi:beta-lactamase class A
MEVRRFAAAVTSSVLTASVLAACSGGGSVTPSSAAATHPAVTLPDTPAGAQARWLIAAMTHLPIGAAALRAHFDAGFLVPVSPASINQMLRGIGGVTLTSSRVSQPGASCAEAVVTPPGATQVTVPATQTPASAPPPPAPPPQPAPPPRPAAKVPAGRCLGATVSAARGPLQLTLVVDPAGLINGLRFGPVIPPAPTTWAGVDAAVRSVAPRVRLLAARVTGRSCQPVHGIDPGTAAPLASASRLYLLDALARSIASGQVSWSQPLTITAQLKSLGAGDLQNQPDGSQVSVLDAAAKMISIGDNTAADMLINLVGRRAVEAALSTAGMADPSRDIPFLTTRQLVTLKLDQWPVLAQRYIAASQAGRRALLASVVDRAPQPSATALAAWRTPRDINSIERFGSASDICRVYASLAALARRPGLFPVASVLEANDGGLGLDPAQWRTTWFLAGSEPGVLASTFMATTRTGHRYVVAVLAENPSAPINQATAVPVLISAIRGAFTLAAHG